MTTVYREYIASDEWKLRRVAALERSAKKAPRRTYFTYWPKCEVCGTHGTHHKNSRSSLDSRERQFRVDGSNGLHVHHITYERLGDENPDDLIVLCTDVCYYDAVRRMRIGPLPERAGCHEWAHQHRAFAATVRDIARSRTY